MVLENLKDYRVILASNSPRRQELMQGLGLNFEVKTLSDIDESYPADLAAAKVAGFIAQRKADAYASIVQEKELIITADTVVVLGKRVLGKPQDRGEAIAMLRALSGQVHQVVTGVCLLTQAGRKVFDALTQVRFAPLSEEEISYYVDNFQPYDKAGAYGVQEWIGYIGVEEIQGSYYNVMGLPIQKLYRELQKI
ncbi:MAG: Maf-like protein [Bacteroides sp.]